jgi:hypothetical protein
MVKRLGAFVMEDALTMTMANSPKISQTIWWQQRFAKSEKQAVYFLSPTKAKFITLAFRRETRSGVPPTSMSRTK